MTLHTIMPMHLDSPSTVKVQSTLLNDYVNINVKGYLYDKRNADNVKLTDKGF